MSTDEAKFYELSNDTIDVIEAIIEKMALPFPIKFKYLGTTVGKKVVQIKKVNDLYQFMTGIDILLIINEDLSMRLDDINLEILLYQELDRIQTNLEKGTIKISGYPLQTTPGVLKKYGIDAVSEANNLEEIAYEQSKDEKTSSTEDAYETSKTFKEHTSGVEFLNDVK